MARILAVLICIMTLAVGFAGCGTKLEREALRYLAAQPWTQLRDEHFFGIVDEETGLDGWASVAGNATPLNASTLKSFIASGSGRRAPIGIFHSCVISA